jgi:hypothetical protein
VFILIWNLLNTINMLLNPIYFSKFPHTLANVIHKIILVISSNYTTPIVYMRKLREPSILLKSDSYKG